jgi:hypothetical protein
MQQPGSEQQLEGGAQGKAIISAVAETFACVGVE